MGLPHLIIVSGPPGTGKTTLAHALAELVGCPAICRDEVKEGMAQATPGFTPTPNDGLAGRTLAVFLSLLELLVKHGVTVVAEAAFQDKVWRPALERFVGRADIRLILCTVDGKIARERVLRRLSESPASRAAHADAALLKQRDEGEHTRATFVPISLDAPMLHVDTTNGYRPTLDEIATFATVRQT